MAENAFNLNFVLFLLSCGKVACAPVRVIGFARPLFDPVWRDAGDRFVKYDGIVYAKD